VRRLRSSHIKPRRRWEKAWGVRSAAAKHRHTTGGLAAAACLLLCLMNWRGVPVPPTTTTPMDRSKHAGHFACWLADYTRAAVRFGKLKIQLRARVCCRSRSLFMKSCVAKRLCVRKTATWNAAALAKYCASANIISWEFGRDDRRLLCLWMVFYDKLMCGLGHLFATP
jgi:hypothetical protein